MILHAVWLQVSVMELYRYSKTISQTVFSMLNLVTYYFKKPDATNETAMTTFDTNRLMTRVSDEIFDTRVRHQTLSARVLILKAIRPCAERVWPRQTIGRSHNCFILLKPCILQRVFSVGLYSPRIDSIYIYIYI